MSDCYENCKDLRYGVCPPMKTFCPKKLEEHDKQVRADTIEKCIKKLAESEDTILSDRQYYVLEQLKGAENEQF